MPAAESQKQLREAFCRWGLPQAMRVDNGFPWASTGDLPTDLVLWLIGLGVNVIHNPARRPQANGVVEHSQGTAKRWAEPGTCQEIHELVRRLERQDAIQRERYPSIHGQTRMEAFPELKHSGRVYRPQDEASKWELSRVLKYLSGLTVLRRVDSRGTISLQNRNRYVGMAFIGKEVHVNLDPIDAEWVYTSPAGLCYRREKASELTAERIRSLNVNRHRQRVRATRHTQGPERPPRPPVT